MPQKYYAGERLPKQRKMIQIWLPWQTQLIYQWDSCKLDWFYFLLHNSMALKIDQ